MLQNPSELDEIIAHLSPIHFVGVNGSGMRPLAEFSASFDAYITGSDRDQPKEHSNVFFVLEKTPEEQEQICNAKTIVISSAIPADHPALELARRQNLKIFHRSELLAIFTQKFKTITIAGTHGKTTTTALIAHALQSLQADPSWIIGASFANGLPSYRRGKSNLLVIEADESDGTFLRYQPHVAVLNNIESDHMDFYQTFDRLKESFHNYIKLVPPNGALIYLSDDGVADQLAESCQGSKLSFGSHNKSDLFLKKIEAKGLASQIYFEDRISNQYIEKQFVLPLTGEHNAFNALATIGVCIKLGFHIGEICKSLETFPGVRRRLQRYPTKSGTLVFDDYAHNPGKILNCITGLRAAFPSYKIFVIFQPHRYSRISSLYQGFTQAFQTPNISVVVLPVYSAGEPHIEGYEAESIARDIAQASKAETFSVTTLKQAVDLVKSKVIPNRDIVLTVGAGDIWKVADTLAQEL